MNRYQEANIKNRTEKNVCYPIVTKAALRSKCISLNENW